MTKLDMDFIRKQFPVFAHAEAGRWAFFENAGGSYAPRQVIDKLDRFMIETKVQPYGFGAPSIAAGKAMDHSKASLAAAINAEVDEVMFGPSTSINTYVLAQALRAQLGSGDEIIVTNQEHEANSGVWRRLTEGNSGIVAREWAVDAESGLLDMAGLTNLLNDRTRYVFVSHCSNIVGAVNDIAGIAKQVHDAGAKLAVDGVSFAPHLAIDVKALDVDFYFFSLYKTYGPHQGLMYVRRECLEGIANQGHFFNEGSLAARLTPAGPQHGEIACASGMVDYLELMHAQHFRHDPKGGSSADTTPHQRVARIMELFHGHEMEQAGRILALLRDKGVRILGAPTAEFGRRAPTIACTSDKWSPSDLATRLSEDGIACGASHFYAWRLLEALGIEPEVGVLRISLVHYTSADDVDRLLTRLDDLL